MLDLIKNIFVNHKLKVLHQASIVEKVCHTK